MGLVGANPVLGIILFATGKGLFALANLNLQLSRTFLQVLKNICNRYLYLPLEETFL